MFFPSRDGEALSPVGSNYDATADAADQVPESLEDNNTSTFHAPTPTPPLCAATGTP
jgi:hypothetical protein